ncbi:MAG TPA: PilZ domain-containing protein [Bryobacteraceae bacterium]|nr:PilZ domain-containing protein [Bryobacteraceae bacterium]
MSEERRKEPRYMCSELVRVLIAAEAPAGTVANLEDISPSGACVQVESPIPVGTAVEIVCSTCRFKGKVRYCRFVEIGYDVGVELEPRGAWDRSRFAPEHLLEIPVAGRGSGSRPKNH